MSLLRPGNPIRLLFGGKELLPQTVFSFTLGFRERASLYTTSWSETQIGQVGCILEDSSYFCPSARIIDRCHHTGPIKIFFKDLFLKKKCNQSFSGEAGEMAQQLGALATLPERTLVQFPATTWQLMAVYNSNSRRAGLLTQPYIVGKAPMNIKINKSLKIRLVHLPSFPLFSCELTDR